MLVRTPSGTVRAPPPKNLGSLALSVRMPHLLCVTHSCAQLLSNYYVSHSLSTGGGVILLALSPGLSGLCLAIFAVLWGFTIIYGSYSRHSQRVVQVCVGQ